MVTALVDPTGAIQSNELVSLGGGGLSTHIRPLSARALSDAGGDEKGERLFSFKKYASGVRNTGPTPDVEAPSHTDALQHQYNLSPQPIVPAVMTESGRPRSPPSGPQQTSGTARHRVSDNIYGVREGRTGANPPEEVQRTGYTAPMPSQTKGRGKPRPRFDFSSLSTNEVMQLEAIHKKLSDGDEDVPVVDGEELPTVSPVPTSTSPPLMIFQRLKSTQAPMPPIAPQQLPVGMDADAMRDLATIKDLPDLGELTKGMDLSLLNRPGGFAILKQQFIERLLHRSMGNRRLRDSEPPMNT